MKLKKIIFAIVCAALLVGSTIACFASASTGTDASIQSTKTYTETATYNGATLKAMGQAGASAAISQVVISNGSSTTKYFGESYVSKSKLQKTIEEDTNTGVAKLGNAITASLAQDASVSYTYYHEVLLHGGTTSSTPIVKTLEKADTY